MQVYYPFNNCTVISNQWKGDNEKMCAVQSRLKVFNICYFDNTLTYYSAPNFQCRHFQQNKMGHQRKIISSHLQLQYFSGYSVTDFDVIQANDFFHIRIINKEFEQSHYIRTSIMLFRYVIRHVLKNKEKQVLYTYNVYRKLIKITSGIWITSTLGTRIIL